MDQNHTQTSHFIPFTLAPFGDHVKINFFCGASLKDLSTKLFSAWLESKKSRAIDIHEGDELNETGLKSLVRTAGGSQ